MPSILYDNIATFIDFRQFSKQMDIVLPKFNFVPTAVPLPSLPDLPRPPNVTANFDINLQ